LTPDEQALARAALLDRAIASPALCERAIQTSVIVPLIPMLASIRGPTSLIAAIALSNRASGITLGRYIYIQQQLFGPAMQLDPTLVVHEVAHVAQYLRDGHLTFLTRYLFDYAQNLRRGLPDYQAYLAIPYEVEARHVASFVHECAQV
jgi:hypothetical protein